MGLIQKESLVETAVQAFQHGNDISDSKISAEAGVRQNNSKLFFILWGEVL